MNNEIRSRKKYLGPVIQAERKLLNQNPAYQVQLRGYILYSYSFNHLEYNFFLHYLFYTHVMVIYEKVLQVGQPVFKKQAENDGQVKK